jgi:hypothetical protein
MWYSSHMFRRFSAILREVFNKEKYNNGQLFAHDIQGKTIYNYKRMNEKIQKSKAAINM